MGKAADSEVLRLRIDSNLKKEASEAAEAMGLTISDVLRMFLVCFASEKKFPFDYEVPNAETLVAMKEAESGKLKPYESVEDYFTEMKL